MEIAQPSRRAGCVHHAADAAREWAEEPEAAAERAAEAVNQWLAGLEGLRWRNLGKPLATLASAKGTATPDSRSDIWPRPASGSHREAWQARPRFDLQAHV